MKLREMIAVGKDEKRMRPEGVLPKPSVKHLQQIPSSTAHTVRLRKMLRQLP